MRQLTVYVASSFKHLHAVQLLSRELRKQGYLVADWTEKATPPEGLNAAQRREWMDTDHGGQVFAFCARACMTADLVLYLGTAGQDAGVEIGMAHAAGRPVLGIRGPLEAPGLMLHGAVTFWAESVEQALYLTAALPEALPEALPGTMPDSTPDSTSNNTPDSLHDTGGSRAHELRERLRALASRQPAPVSTRAVREI